ERSLFINWLASLIQRPGQKPNWHLVFGSTVHGVGKDSLIQPLTRGLGSNFSTIGTEDIEGQWTGWAENKQLVIVSEISTFERRSVAAKMKSYLAAPPEWITINRKNVPQ